MDLREELNELIQESGHYVLLQRASRRIRCVCWDEKYQESSVEKYHRETRQLKIIFKTCPRCLGKGWISRIERHKIRRDNASQVIALPQLIKQNPYGQLGSDAKVFYMEHDTHPKKGDYIYEVGWDGQKPTHLIQAYQINSAEDLRGDNGRIEFYSVVTEEMNISTQIRQFVIRQMGPVKNYEPIYGGDVYV